MLTFNNNRLQPLTLSGKNGSVRLCGEGTISVITRTKSQHGEANVSELDKSFLDCNEKFPCHGVSHKEQEVEKFAMLSWLLQVLLFLFLT
jgi:hypothetical protein